MGSLLAHVHEARQLLLLSSEILLVTLKSENYYNTEVKKHQLICAGMLHCFTGQLSDYTVHSKFTDIMVIYV